MGFLDWVTKSKRIEIAEFTISTFYQNGSNHSTARPWVEITSDLKNSNIDPQKVYFLAALEVAQHSFFRLYGGEKERAISLWERAIESNFPKENSKSDPGIQVASTRVQLFFGKGPFGIITPKLEKSAFTPGKVVSESALAFFSEMRSRIKGDLLEELAAAIKFGLESWAVSNPKSTESTWPWLLWIDYPAWVQEAVGSYSISGKPTWRWITFSNPSLCISLNYPDIYKVVQQEEDELSTVVSFAWEGRFFFRAYKDNIRRGERFLLEGSNWTASDALERIVDYWKTTFKSSGKEVTFVSDLEQVKLGDHEGWQTEIVMFENSVEMGRTFEAVCKLDDETIGGLYMWTPEIAQWMSRMVFDRIRSTLVLR